MSAEVSLSLDLLIFIFTVILRQQWKIPKNICRRYLSITHGLEPPGFWRLFPQRHLRDQKTMPPWLNIHPFLYKEHNFWGVIWKGHLSVPKKLELSQKNICRFLRLKH